MSRRTVPLLATLTLLSCSGSSTTPTPPPAAVATVTVSPLTASVQVGQTVALSAATLDASSGVLTGRTVSWSSNPQSVATVVNGVVTGLSAGVATITATSEGKSGTAQVTVTPLPVETVVVTPPTASVQVGQTVALSAATLAAGGGTLTGRTVSWSSNPQSVATVVNGVVTGVSAGVATITATSEGKSGSAEVTVMGAPPPAIVPSVGAGGGHSCALLATGAAYCWGANDEGALGDGTMAGARSTAAPVVGGHIFKQLAVGNLHTCGLKPAGTVFCWGDGRTGELGDGGTTSRAVPGPVSTDLTFERIAVGGSSGHTCGLTAAGTLHCWGWNSFGQLGDGTTANRSTPVQVIGLPPVRDIVLGYANTCALTLSGAAWCWGNNHAGTLGDGTTTNRPTPAPVAGGHTFDALSRSPGRWHHCALKANGSTWCWGRNRYGQLGPGAEDGLFAEPVAVGEGHSWASVNTGGDFVCGLTTTGDVLCWGANWVGGELGDGTAVISRAFPAPVAGGRTYTALSSGTWHSCAIASDGVYCWGLNILGQVGDGTNVNRGVPTPVVGLP